MAPNVNYRASIDQAFIYWASIYRALQFTVSSKSSLFAV